jgi:hypothetical protein
MHCIPLQRADPAINVPAVSLLGREHLFIRGCEAAGGAGVHALSGRSAMAGKVVSIVVGSPQ